jgi:leader peptidase (prepilin peptidase) / N-methyltransferase
MQQHTFSSLLSVYISPALYVRTMHLLSLLTITVFVPIIVLLAIYDYKYFRLPNWLTFPGYLAGLLLHLLSSDQHALSYFCLSIVSFVFILLINLLYTACRRRSGMGVGDFKMIAMLSVWWGGLALLDIISISVSAALLFTPLFERSCRFHTQVPFGYFLCIGSLIWCMFHTNYIFYS